MKILVTYASAMGSTAEIAARIAETLRREGAEVTLRAADEVMDEDLRGQMDAFVIGGAVHGGHWLPAANAVALRMAALDRPVWLFSSGPVGERYVNSPQPEPREVAGLCKHLQVRDHAVFAGAFDRNSPGVAELGRMERFAARWIPEGDYRNWPRIESWARAIVREVHGHGSAAADRPLDGAVAR
jgi:menaquinone-dependent protoporphyrinogen oxidase